MFVTEGLEAAALHLGTNQNLYEICTTMDLPNTHPNCCYTKRWRKCNPQTLCFRLETTHKVELRWEHTRVESLWRRRWNPSDEMACAGLVEWVSDTLIVTIIYEKEGKLQMHHFVSKRLSYSFMFPPNCCWCQQYTSNMAAWNVQ